MALSRLTDLLMVMNELVVDARRDGADCARCTYAGSTLP